MQRGIVTKISVYEDFPTSVSSTAFGANLNCLAFNMGFIVDKNPDLAKQLIELYKQCKKLKE